MRQRRAYGMVCLLLLVVAFPMASAVDSTVSVDTTWTGDMVLSGNITVASGATLTVEPGATVDARTYNINVEGSMVVERAQFYSSVVPQTQGSHGQGLWPSGLWLKPVACCTSPTAWLPTPQQGCWCAVNWLEDGITVNDAYRGVSVVGGSANITALEANQLITKPSTSKPGRSTSPTAMPMKSLLASPITPKRTWKTSRSPKQVWASRRSAGRST